MPCITTSSTMTVDSLDDSSGVIYYVVVGLTAPTTITFTHSGTIDSITVAPDSIRPEGNSVTFGYNDLNTTFTVTVNYSDPSLRDDPVHPLETPTKLPKFRPVTSCPS
jgi:hypothetical protein